MKKLLNIKLLLISLILSTMILIGIKKYFLNVCRDYNNARMIWVNSLSNLVEQADEDTEFSITFDAIKDIFYKNVAGDFSYLYKGTPFYATFSHDQYIDLIHMYKSGLVSEKNMDDPLRINHFFDQKGSYRGPDNCLFFNSKIMDSKENYKKFCDWLNNEFNIRENAR